MDLDKNIENFLWDEERKYNLEPYKSDTVWNEIEKNIKSKRKWYERLRMKFRGKDKLIVDIAAIAIAILIISMIPITVINYKSSHCSTPISNDKKSKTNMDDKNDEKNTRENNSNNSTNNSQNNNLENTNCDQFMVAGDENLPKNIKNVIIEKAKSQFQKYTIFYCGEIGTARDVPNMRYKFEVYENRTDTKFPKFIEYEVDSVNAKITREYSASGNRLADGMCAPTLGELICKIEGYSDDSHLFISDTDYLYEYKDSKGVTTFYGYDKSSGIIYKEDGSRENRKQIYKYDPDAYSILTDEENIDINGDGKPENIKIDRARGVLTIEGVSISCSYVERISHGISKLNDKKTLIYEIFGSTDVPPINFFNYKDGLIYKCGELAQGQGIQANGDNKIVIKHEYRCFFEGWFLDSEYTLNDSGKLVEINKQDFYKLDEGLEEIKVKQPVTLYKNKNSSQVAVQLKPGDSVHVIGTDNNAWVLLQDKDGTQGWLEMESPHVVKELNKDSTDVFSGLINIR